MRRHLTTALAASLLAAPALAATGPIEVLVFPSQQVTLSAPIDGILEEIPVEEGLTVKEGERVARMDDGMQRIEVVKAELNAANQAPLQEAALILEETQIRLERAQESMEKEAASEWEVRGAQVERDRAEVQRDNAVEVAKINQAEVTLQKELLEQYDLRAPFDGVVLRRSQEPGANLQRGDEIVSLIKLHPLKAEAHVPVEFYDQLVVGQQYPLTDATLGFDKLNAELIFIAPLIDSASNTFRVVFEIDNEDLSMPAGFEVFLSPQSIKTANGSTASAAATE